jgi:NAD(P)-dependent dehydrogenase (short-subunit alcohol dehydrogenase family)
MFNIITKTERDVGPIGLFVANAGVGGGSPGVSATDKEWATMGGVNTMQHIFWARHLVPRMVQRGGGYIVITSSAAGLLYVNSLMYKVTKAAAIALGEWIAITHGGDGIGVSCLCPQGVRTNLFATSAAYGKGTTVPDEGDAAEHLEEIGSGVAGGDGVLEVDEVAALTLDCVERGEFLVLPHKEVLQYVQRKASDTTRWVRSARKMAAVFSQEAIAEARAPSKL